MVAGPDAVDAAEAWDLAPLVVVVDGDAERRHRAAATLTAGGYEVLEAATPMQGLASWRAADADAVVMDLDADDASRALSALVADRPRERRTPVLTFSADRDVDRTVQALAEGAWDHLRAPFEPRELLARVNAGVRLANTLEHHRRRAEELEYLGSIDGITGLANRRQIEEDLIREAAAAARHHHALSAVMASIDHWDVLAGEGGAVTADILRETAVLIRAICRTGDVAGRWDDHQFLVILPVTDGAGARVFAERLRAVVGAAPVLTRRGPLPVSLSAGCATGAPGAAELAARAQAALEQAQEAGGDTLAAIWV